VLELKRMVEDGHWGLPGIKNLSPSAGGAIKMSRRPALGRILDKRCGPAIQGISDVMRSVGRTGWDCPMPTSPDPL
jgi:hypothetical protein